MIRLAILLLISFSGKLLHAQNGYADINKVLETVIQDFPSGLTSIKGQAVVPAAANHAFYSTVNITGATPATIIEERSLGRKWLSWKTILYTTTNPEEVKIKYKEVFDQLNQSIIKSRSDKPFILSGKFREPFLTKIASSHFSLLPSTGELKDIKVDLAIERNARGYVLTLSVSSRTL